jgi:hypothetical protein
MPDPFLVIVIVVAFILMIIVNLYILAHFLHPLDSGFGSSPFVKGVVVSFKI